MVAVAASPASAPRAAVAPHAGLRCCGTAGIWSLLRQGSRRGTARPAAMPQAARDPPLTGCARRRAAVLLPADGGLLRGPVTADRAGGAVRHLACRRHPARAGRRECSAPRADAHRRAAAGAGPAVHADAVPALPPGAGAALGVARRCDECTLGPVRHDEPGIHQRSERVARHRVPRRIQRVAARTLGALLARSGIHALRWTHLASGATHRGQHALLHPIRAPLRLPHHARTSRPALAAGARLSRCGCGRG